MLDFFSNIDQIVINLLHNHGSWAYVIPFLIVFCETGVLLFAFLPGDTLLITAGTLAATGAVNLHLMLFVILAAALLGNSVNYWTGRGIGESLLRNKEARWLKYLEIEKGQAFYKKYGGATIILARWVPFVRTFAPFIAGVAMMDYRRFVLTDLVGAITWVFALVLAGYWFGHLPMMHEYLGIMTVSLVLFSLIPILYFIYRGVRLAFGRVRAS